MGAERTEQRKHEADLIEKAWETAAGDRKRYEGETFKGVEIPKETCNDDTLYTREIKKNTNHRSSKGAKKYRFGQFNILGHGLSDTSSGFAALYRDGLEKTDFFEKKMEGGKPVLKDGKPVYTGKNRSKEILEKLNNPHKELLFGDHGKDGYVGLLKVPELRFKRVLGCLLRQDLDVISMEEVDHYHDHWEPELAKFGYAGIFHNKNISQAARFNGGSRDGVAIFYNRDRLECIFSQKFVLPDAKGKDSTQIGLYAVLRDLETGEIFSKVAAHCKSGKAAKDQDTKDAQAKFLADLVTNLSSMGLRPVLGLDFNSNYKEKVIETTFKNGAKHMMSAYEQIPGELAAAYKIYEKLTAENAHKPENNGKAPMTAWKNRLFGEQLHKAGKQFKEELDFIFCEQIVWQVCGALMVPQREEIEALKMPGWKYPSDHFMIMAELELVDKTEVNNKINIMVKEVNNDLKDLNNAGAFRNVLEQKISTLMARLLLLHPKSLYIRGADLVKSVGDDSVTVAIRGKPKTVKFAKLQEVSVEKKEKKSRRTRRRLAYGACVSPVLAALMDEIEEAKRYHA